MKRDLSERIYIATICENFRQSVSDYGLGIELDHFCMAENLDGYRRGETISEISSLVDEVKPRGLILHAPFNELFPAAVDPKARQLAMERLGQAADAAKELGARKMVVHSGYMPHVYFKDWHKERSVEFWNRFMEDRGIDIVIENVLEDEPYMMLDMMEKMGNDRIRLCLDTGHALCVSKVPVLEWVDVLSPYIGHLHIHNNDGKSDKHASLDDGILEMEDILERVTKRCGDVSITVEARDDVSSLNWLVHKGYLKGKL